jgi:metal-responsive CopG/Arc/MetJ family transcriptional regulator
MADQQINASTKKRGRPATGKGLTIGVRMQPDLLADLDAFIADSGLDQTRPEAIRSIVQATLSIMKKGTME